MLGFAQNALVYVAAFLFVLTLVITVHEFGHFLVARLCGVAVDRFSIGFGRAILSWRGRDGMEWTIGWIPLGGYVRFTLDENVASVPDQQDLDELRSEIVEREGAAALKRYFHFKPLWQRALVTAGGPAANFILAILIFAVFAMAAGEVILTKPRVGVVTPNSPAAHAGFLPGDLIKSANGWRMGDFRDLQRFVVYHAGEPIRFEVDRAGAPIELTATPDRRAASGIGGQSVPVGFLGLRSSAAPADNIRMRFGPVAALGQGVQETVDIVGTSLTYLRRIVTGYESGDQLSGPLGIFNASGDVATAAAKGAPSTGEGLARAVIMLMQMAGFISVAVGFANLLPIPVLDGGHLLFYGYEAIARRPLAANIQAAGYRVGFALLIGLMLFVTWNDLQRYRVIHFIGGLFS